MPRWKQCLRRQCILYKHFGFPLLYLQGGIHWRWTVVFRYITINLGDVHANILIAYVVGLLREQSNDLSKWYTFIFLGMGGKRGSVMSLATTKKCFATTKKCFATTEESLATTRKSFVTNKKCFATTKKCFVTNKKCLATTKKCFVTNKKCLATTKKCFVTNKKCLATTKESFATTNCVN